MRRHWVIGLALLVSVILAALPAAAQGGDIVSQVNGTPITRDAFHARVRLVRWQYLHEMETLYDATGGNLQITDEYVIGRAADLNDPDRLGDDVLHELEEERLLRQTVKSSVSCHRCGHQSPRRRLFSLWTGVPVEQLATNLKQNLHRRLVRVRPILFRHVRGRHPPAV
jgi:hypothetical protein